MVDSELWDSEMGVKGKRRSRETVGDIVKVGNGSREKSKPGYN